MTLIFGQKLYGVVLSPLVSPVLAHDAVGVAPAHLNDLAGEVYRQAKIDGGLQFEALLFSDASPDTFFGRLVGDIRGVDGLWK